MFYIRADVNGIIGTGHIMRCLAIATEMRERSEEVVFLVADKTGQKVTEDYGFKTICLDSQWNCLEQELGDLLPLVKNSNASGLLVDSYYVTKTYLNSLHHCIRLAYIDDVDEFIYPVDLLVNYNIYAEKADYAKRYRKTGMDTEFLLGCNYVPLRKEFCDIQKNYLEFPKQEGTGNGNKKILVTSGGADICNVTSSLLHKLEKKHWFDKVDLHVILGRFYQYKHELHEIWTGYPNVYLHENVTDMSKYMLVCDIAVTAGGSTVYELCACGLPSIMYTVADNQLGIAHEFNVKGLVPWCGDAREDIDICMERIIYNMEILLWDEEILKETSIRLQSLVDGHGAIRIAERLLQCF